MFSKSRMYTIATAHLDTVWNWDFEYVIEVCLKNTLYDNFKLFEKYPNYRFNFEGSYRYELFEEYYPEEFEKLKEYINEDKWNVTGSAYENGDVNIPSPEHLFRNILYGNKYFQEKFGKKSNDIFLPDCFGFGYALPSIISHSNLKGFSTQKLTWGGAYDRPFDIGYWQGPDGNRIIASLDSRSYTTTYKEIRTKNDLLKKLEKNTKDYGLNATLGYHGVGDVGGAPKEESVITLEKELKSNDSSTIEVLSSTPTEFFNDIDNLSDKEKAQLPVWNNELVMTDHGVGSYTSRAFSKRMNRRNEELADMAERASVIASSISSMEYPSKTLEKGWKRTIAHTFHDDITGTSVQRVYKRSWNDLVLSANQMSSTFDGSCSEIIRNINTSWVKGTPIVVSNMLEFDRTGVVDFTIPALGYKYIRVFDSLGREVPSQINSIENDTIFACVFVNVKAMGFSVYDVMYSYEPCQINTGLRSESHIIENYKYQVAIDKNGDIASIIDRLNDNRQLLSKPIRFELNKYNGTKEYAAWEMDFKELNKYPWEFAENGIVENIEKGPCRVTIKVTQTCNKSTFTYYVSLCAAGQYVSVYNEIEWREFKRALHNGFSFTAHNENATYDLGLGCIKRKVANKKLYSVPAQKWADITDESGEFGISVFSDSKYGWMMKNENTLRLTVIHTPKNYYRADSCQGFLEFGLNRYGYAIYSHVGDDLTETQRQAKAFNQPLAAFVTNKHVGTLESQTSFIKVSDPSVIVRAVKKAEDSDEIVIRVNEGSNKHLNDVEIALGTSGIQSAREIYASEEYKCDANVVDGKLVFSLKPYEVKSFAVVLEPNKVASANRQIFTELPYNINVMTSNADMNGNEIPVIKASIPVEQVPDTVNCGGINFKLKNDISSNNAVIADGQRIKVNGNRLYILCASLHGDKSYNFGVGDSETGIKVQSINERVGAWDLYELAETGYIKKDPLGLEITHTNSKGKRNSAAQLYFFVYKINTENLNEIVLPSDNGLLLLAATEIFDDIDVTMITELYDSLEKRDFTFEMSSSEKKEYKKLKKKFQRPHNQS